MADKIQLQDYAKVFSKYVRGVKSAYLKPFRDEIRAMRNESAETILKTNLGRSLWKSGNPEKPPAGTPRFLVGKPRMRFSKSESVFVGGFKILGMAALMVKGGKTLPHAIRPKRGKFLAFTDGGSEVFARSVNHPGSRIRSESNIIQRILERRAARFSPAAVRALDSLAKESFR